jgi:hypothetical protein
MKRKARGFTEESQCAKLLQVYWGAKFLTPT